MKRNSLTKNVMFGFLSWFLPLGLSFAATPLIVRGLGVEQFGVYALVLGFISYSFTFNIARSIIKYVSEFKVTNDTKKISEIISTAFWLNLLVGIIGMIIIVVFSKWFVVNLLKIEDKLQGEAVNALYLASIIILAGTTAQVFSSIIQAIHRFDIYSFITVVNTSVLTVGNIILVWYKQKMEVLMVWTLFMTFLGSLIFFFFSRRLLPDFKLSFSFSGKIISLVLKYSFAVIITQTLGNIMVIFERSWITSKLGSEAVTYYVIPLNLGIYVHAFVSSITLVILPLSSEIEALGDKEKLLTIYTKASKIVLVLAAFLCLTLINGRNLILRLWVGSDFSEKSSETLIAHALTFSLLAISIISFQVIEGIGLPKVSAVIVFGWFILSIPLMILLTNDYGILGVGAGRLMGAFILIPAIFYIEKRSFGKPLWKFWEANLVKIGISVILASIVQSLSFNNFDITWITLICGTVLGAFAFSFVLLIVGFFSVNEKIWLKSLFDKMIIKTFLD